MKNNEYVTEVFVRIKLEDVAEYVSNLDCVDDIVKFVLSCIPDDEVADAVIDELKKPWGDI